ncbi:MAG: arylsulfatase [Verrucomicrobiota bacterium]|nr:arylsulfatase [Verrucomicrobiota bacterium]
MSVFKAQTQPTKITQTPPGTPRVLQGVGPGPRSNTGLPLGIRPGQQKGPTTPNIIFIMADDLGWGDLGCYGQKLIKTPHLNRLAAEGMRFTQCYAGSPMGDASRAVMLTGMHSGHSYIRGNRGIPLRGADLIIPMYLRGTRKYETIALGKWNLGGKGTRGAPFEKGFNHWIGFVDQIHANNHYPTFVWRYEPGIRGINSWNGDVQIPANHGRRAVYSTDLLTKAALNTIRIYRPSWETGFRPFFMYLSYTAPHANNELARKTGQGMEVPNAFPYTGKKWPRAEKNKAAVITRLDNAIGQIMAKLKEFNMEEDTVIFFTSDNGPHQEGGNDPAFFSSAGPFRGIKRSLNEGGLRVPMIVRWTGKIKGNSVSEQVFPFWDLMPTILQIARIPTPREIDGISLMPTLIGLPQKQQHDYLYWESHVNGSQQASRKRDWKVIRPAPSKALELYDLSKDPGESQNVAAHNPEVIKEFETFLRTARTRSLQWPITMPGKNTSNR